jgi:hypothetical protein
MKRLVLISAVLLAGCETMPVKTVVDVPVAVACVDEKPAKPNLVSDDELRAMNDYQLVLALWRDRIQRSDYESKLEVVVDGCLKATR